MSKGAQDTWRPFRPWGRRLDKIGASPGHGIKTTGSPDFQKRHMLWLERIMPLQKLAWKQINVCVVDELRNAGLIEQKLSNPPDFLSYAVSEAHLTERGRRRMLR